jgi:hypothetical protein
MQSCPQLTAAEKTFINGKGFDQAVDAFHGEYVYDYTGICCNEPNPEEMLIMKQFYKNLSKDAQIVIEFILYNCMGKPPNLLPEAYIVKIFNVRNSECSNKYRRFFSRSLWFTNKRINEVFREIRNNLKKC